jgi:ATP-dependent DNA helicase DinG
VGGELSSLLFSRLDSAVLTSASLRVPGGREGFQFFLHRTGLDILEEEGREVRLLALDSPFDYSRQVRMIAVSDLPDPAPGKGGFQRYMEGISRVVEDALVATGGKALVLLTSHQQVEYLHSELRPRLEQRGLCCLRQQKGVPNALLLERFRMDRDSVLLATEAFWEGVDVPGESLSAVIVVKLPFRHPEDPVVAGRMEHHDAAGRGGWGFYYMPLAVTLFRQGIGRLVRRSTDRGIILVLDPRFLNRSYSKYFHAALPKGLRVEAVSTAGLPEAMQRGFN